MTYNVTATYTTEAAKREGAHPIDMYVVNASLSGWEPLYYANINQDIYGFTLNSTSNLTNTETLYSGLPISRSDIDTNVAGEIGEISVTVPNADRVMESVIQGRQYLRGRDIHVISGFAKHLPSGVTANHIGTSPDRHAFMKEKMYIDSVTSNEQVVVFTCKSKFNIKNVVLPKRSFYKECTWAIMGNYLGSECDPQDTINTASYPTCDGTLDNCRQRHNSGRFGGFPSIPRRGIVLV
jgi:lambda family phage minor tail protein L